MKRLYVQIYLTVVASLVIVVLLAGGMWRLAFQVGPGAQFEDMAGRVASAVLPAADSSRAEQGAALERLAAKLNAQFALFDANGERIAAAPAETDLAVPTDRSPTGWNTWRNSAWAIHMPDERWLVVRVAHQRVHPGWSWLGFLGLIALAVALAAHPVVRRLSRRIERLEASVNALGEGDLSTRVRVHGHDEVARLARSFNRAAARIETLVKAHRMLLANASHELRTPLARIRLGVELQKQSPDPRRAAELERDIAELDELIEEILTASRLDAAPGLETREEIDLLALAAEEGARYEDCHVEGEAVLVKGDARLLRRMLRNLMENAHRHGAPPIELRVRHGAAADHAAFAAGQAAGRVATQQPAAGRVAMVHVEVCDHGRGVPEAERERIFEPFYRVAGAAGNVGTGLGLALVRQIARRHGGEATAGERPGGGTCIHVSLAVDA